MVWFLEKYILVELNKLNVSIIRVPIAPLSVKLFFDTHCQVLLFVPQCFSLNVYPFYSFTALLKHFFGKPVFEPRARKSMERRTFLIADASFLLATQPGAPKHFITKITLWPLVAPLWRSVQTQLRAQVQGFFFQCTAKISLAILFFANKSDFF